jgi:hypothetical protein
VLSTLVIVVSPMKRFNPPCPPCTTKCGNAREAVLLDRLCLDGAFGFQA